MAAGSHIRFDLCTVMLDHPRSAIAGLSLVLKFGLDPIYSFWRYCDFFAFLA